MANVGTASFSGALGPNFQRPWTSLVGLGVEAHTRLVHIRSSVHQQSCLECSSANRRLCQSAQNPSSQQGRGTDNSAS